MSETLEVVVGVIGRPHGLQGEVAIQVRTDEPDRRFADGQRVRIEDTRRYLTVVGTRWQQGRLIARFAELPDRSAVEQVRAAVLVTDVPADETPEEEGEYYDRQLVGLRALTTDGVPVGTVSSVIHLLAQDLLAIQTDAGERLVPFVEALVPHVDLAAGTLTLAPVPGLLDDADEQG